MINHHLRAAIDDEWEKRRLLTLRPSLTPRDLDELIHPPGGRHYGHVMPTRVQAKMVVWDKFKFYAEEAGGKPNEAELLYKLPNGNKVQLFGADDPDAMRGFMGSGISFDEYSQQPRNIFSEVLSKSLGDHLGYAIFLGTIKGHDHLYDTYEAAKNSEDWFSLWQDVDQSLSTEEGITIQLLQQAMEDDRKLILQGLMSQAEYDQEWFLSPEAAIKGAFYGDQMKLARTEKRITRVPYDPMLPVDTDWDLGIDAMAVWFSQSTRSGEVRLIDYYEDIGGGLELAIKAIKGQMPNQNNSREVEAANARRSAYTYGSHWGPHDIETREISSGKTRRQIAFSLGLTFKVTPKLEVDQGITAAQFLFKRCWFDEIFCKKGILALTHYRRGYNQKLGVFTAVPIHDEASHGCLTGESLVDVPGGRRRIDTIKVGDPVWTPCGYSIVTNAGLVKMADDFVEIKTTRYTLRCTPEHKIFTNRGLVRADDLRYSHRILGGGEWTIILNSWISMVIGLGFRDLITGKTDGVRRGHPISTARCGKRRMGEFLRIMKSIIEIATPSTMSYRISSLFTAPNISESIQWNVFVMENSSRLAKSRVSWLRSGTDRNLAENGIKRTASEHGKSANGFWRYVVNAAAAIPRLILLAPSGAQRIVKIKRGDLANAPVYDLTVFNHSCYRASGMLVSNSDAFRGLAVRHKTPEQKREKARSQAVVTAWS